MSSTRKLIIQLENDKAILKQVDPTKALFIRSMPCEKSAAKTRNSTIDCMSINSFEDVSYWYLRNKRAELNSKISILIWECAAIFTLCLIWHENKHNFHRTENAMEAEQSLMYNIMKAMLVVFGFAVIIGNILPNIANATRYEETRKFCEKWLREKMGDKFDRIYHLRFFEHEKLDDILKEEHIAELSANYRLNKYRSQND